MRLSLRTFAFVAILGLGAVSAPKPADASVAIAVLFDDMVSRADTVAVVTGTDTKSMWEDRRIVTYTRLRVDRHIAGETMTSDVWVKTLGGIVDNVGQTVSGEPSFGGGTQNLVFLKRVDSRPTYMVIERAQGEYPLTKDLKTGRMILGRNSEGGMLVPPKAPMKEAVPSKPLVLTGSRYAGALAMDVMLHRPVDDVAKDIAESWQKLHATK